MYFNKYRNRLKVLLGTETRQFDGAPLIAKIVYDNRVDLIKILYEEDAEWVHGFVHGLIRVAKEQRVEEIYQFLCMQKFFRNWNNLKIQ